MSIERRSDKCKDDTQIIFDYRNLNYYLLCLDERKGRKKITIFQTYGTSG